MFPFKVINNSLLSNTVDIFSSLPYLLSLSHLTLLATPLSLTLSLGLPHQSLPLFLLGLLFLSLSWNV